LVYFRYSQKQSNELKEWKCLGETAFYSQQERFKEGILPARRNCCKACWKLSEVVWDFFFLSPPFLLFSVLHYAKPWINRKVHTHKWQKPLVWRWKTPAV